mmetsp:Transcript_34204/g.77008  ORF Transcript_34204/g.77008 Transcript_34204/m.77008 type:complete len:89 (-) Transcript_34204:13-279(-)
MRDHVHTVNRVGLLYQLVQLIFIEASSESLQKPQAPSCCYRSSPNNPVCSNESYLAGMDVTEKQNCEFPRCWWMQSGHTGHRLLRFHA